MATTIEQIQKLVEEVGPSMPEIDAVVQTEEPSWAIQFSDDTVIILEPADDPSRVVMSADLGGVADAQQRIVYETLLCYNLMWRSSGGVKVGLAGPEGTLIISADVCLDNLTLSDFQQEIGKFLKITRSCVQYVLHAEQGEQSVLPPLPGMGMSGMHLQA